MNDYKKLINENMFPKINKEYSQKTIAIVGAGNIVKNIHIPAYLKAGFRIKGLFDINKENAQALCDSFKLDKCYQSLEALVGDSEVDIVDIAIPSKGRENIIRACAEHGKHMLVQKPLSLSVAEGQTYVDITKKNGVKLCVNQNARWGGAYRAAKLLLEQKAIGEVYYISHQLYSDFDWLEHHNPWHFELERYQLIQYGIHHFDIMRHWLERMPRSVFAHVSRRPEQAFRGDMLATVVLDFDDHCHASLLENNALYPKRAYKTCFEIHGSEGCLLAEDLSKITLFNKSTSDEGIILDLSDYPQFPGGFIYTMYQLMQALASDSTAKNEAAEVLPSVDMVEKAYLSAERGEKIYFRNENV